MGIYIAPGGPIAIREGVFNIAKKVGNPFNPQKALSKKYWTTIYERVLLNEDFIVGHSEEDCREELRAKWETFFRDEFPIITNSVTKGLDGLY
jgi:hypothetical protein